MTRIVGGSAGRRRLETPAGRDTRPTSDRAREGLFSALAGTWPGARVLDLYAGSGAVGLEALSRGAAVAVLVESDVRAAAVITRNVDALGLPGARVVVDRVERFLAQPGRTPYDVVFADPPYALSADVVARMLGTLAEGWLADGGYVVVERASRDAPPAWPAGLEAVQQRRYGEGTLWYGRAT